jgi:hypothetical protein
MFMTSQRSFFGLFLAVLALLPGCYHVPSYKRTSLRMVSTDFSYGNVKNNVILQVKHLHEAEKHAMVGCKAGRLKNSFKVLCFSINNLSDSSYIFSPADIDLTLTSYTDIAKTLKTNSLRGITTGAVATASTAVVCMGAGAFGMIQQLPVLFPVLGVLTTGIAVVSFSKGIKSAVMNRRVKNDLKEKTFHEQIILNPGSHYEGLIFIKYVDYKSQFNVTIHEKDGAESIAFDVDLCQQ